MHVGLAVDVELVIGSADDNAKFLCIVPPRTLKTKVELLH